MYVVDGIASIVFLVGILDIINTMGFNLNERKREIGILKTLGFSRRQLIMSLSLEAGLLGLLGSIIGVVVGSLGVIIIGRFYWNSYINTDTIMVDNWSYYNHNHLKHDFRPVSIMVCSRHRY